MFSHGIKRVKGKKQPIDEKELLIMKKSDKVCREFLELRKSYKTSNKSLDELLAYSSGVLELMTDQPTVINFRQELTMQKFEDFSSQINQKAKEDQAKEKVLEIVAKLKEFVAMEIKFNTKLVMTDLKSYQLWFYRLWLLKKYALFEKNLMTSHKELLELNENNFLESKSFKFIFKDLKMCEQFLMKDERNFHTWNYRFNLWNSMVEIYPNFKEKMLEAETGFLNLIHQKNYSNYSTIHFKIKHYQQLILAGKDLSDTFMKELQKVYEGLYISPNEQACYIFQKWLFDQLRPKVVLRVRTMNPNGNWVLLDNFKSFN